MTPAEQLAYARQIHAEAFGRLRRSHRLHLADDFSDLSIAELTEAMRGRRENGGTTFENVREIRKRRFTVIEGGDCA